MLGSGAIGPPYREARDDLLRQRRMRVAMTSNLLEIERRDLRFGRYGLAEDTATGRRYRVMRGEVDALHSPTVAYTVDGADVIFLEPA